MKQFFYCFDFEFKKSLRLRNIILAALFTLLALYFAYNGANIYNNITSTKENFKQIEKMKMERYISYKQMGERGFSVMYIPPPLMVFFYDSGVFSNLNAAIDVEERLKMDISVKGKDMFTEKRGNHRDFSGLFLLFGTLLVLFYGFDTFPSIDFLQHRAAGLGFNRAFFPVLAARFAVIALFFILVMVLGILVAMGKGIVLGGGDFLMLAAFLALWLLVSLGLLAAGILIAGIRDEKTGHSVIFIIWICLVYLLTMGIDQVTANRANSISANFQLELDKLSELMSFEERAKKELDKYTDEKEIKEVSLNLVESLFNKELLNILAIERKLEQGMRRIIWFYQKSAVIFPGTFYESVALEMSGNGYENGAAFLLHLVDLKYKFCLFIKQKRFYHDDEPVVPFIKEGEENLFYGTAHIPAVYPAGMMLLAIYALALAAACFFLYRFAVLNMKTGDVNSVKIDKEKMNFKKGDYAVYEIKKHAGKDLLYCLFSGRNREMKEKGLNGKVMVNGLDIVEKQNPAGFTYICDPRSLPRDSAVGDLITFAARSFNITGDQKDKIMEIHGLTGLKKKLTGKVGARRRAEITLALARMTAKKNKNIYLFYNTALGLGSGFARRFIDLVKELNHDGASVIYLTGNLLLEEEKKAGDGFFRWDDWNRMVENSFKVYNEDIKEEKQ